MHRRLALSQLTELGVGAVWLGKCYLACFLILEHWVFTFPARNTLRTLILFGGEVGVLFGSKYPPHIAWVAWHSGLRISSCSFSGDQRGLAASRPVVSLDRRHANNGHDTIMVASRRTFSGRRGRETGLLWLACSEQACLDDERGMEWQGTFLNAACGVPVHFYFC